MLIERGVLVEAEEGWQTTRQIDQLDIPPSIQALLTARLDQLSPEERAVTEPAAVIGLEFPSAAVRELVPSTARDAVGERLDQLVHRQLVRPTPLEEREFDDHRFTHLLIRDAAYQRILKRARADLHERFADWLEHFDESHGRPGERDEIVGYHLEQSVTHRQQLGAPDIHVNVLAARAAEKLAAAGQRAFVRGDLPAAATMLRRAVDMLPRQDPTRLAMLPDLAETLLETGDFAAASAVLEEADESETDRSVEAARAALVELMIDLQVGADAGWADHAEAEIARASRIFEAARHHRGLATAARLRYALRGSALRFDAAVADAQTVIDHARRAGDLRQQRRGAIAYATASLHGPTHVDEAIERCEELIAAIDGDRRSQAVVQLCLAQLLALRGEFDQARTLANAARGMLDELGQSVLAASTSTDTAPIELLAGDAEAAEGRLRDDLVALEAMGESYLRSTVAGMLARVLVRAGPSAEAERLATEVRQLAAPDDVDAQILWRSALSRQLTHTGDIDEALRLADEAVALTHPAGAPVLTAQSLTDRAFVLVAAGREADAVADLDQAERLYRDKGAAHAASSARRVVPEPQ
jgi:predicted ATPase